jgi:uncharacterized LabA/DUF88 family protein
MTQPSQNLTKAVIELGADLRSLQYRAPYLEAKTLKSEVSLGQQKLQAIYREAESEQIDLLPYYQALAEIEANLKIIQAGHHLVNFPEKIALFIDGANLYAVAHDFLKVKIDFARLLTYFSQNAIILRAFYYVAYDPVEGDNIPYLVWLKRNGYHVVTKPVKEVGDGVKKGNLDIEIALDMLELADKVDRVVLFSGDGDFAPLLKRVGREGTKTQAISYWGNGEGPTAAELIETADVFTELKDILPFVIKAD